MTSNPPTKTGPTTQQAQAPKLVIERTFNATPQRLWSYWTEPTKYAKWLNPAPIDLVIHEWDLRVGGQVRFDMPQPDGNRNPQEGMFHELTPYTRLVTGSPDKSFLLVAEFQPVGADKTHLKVTVTGVPPEWHAAATVGWTTCLDKMERLLSDNEAAAAAVQGSAVAANRVVDETQTPGPGDGFRLIRHLPAPPEKVWRMWTTKEGLGKWWALGAKDIGYDFRVAELDVRVGGKYDIVMSNQKQGELHNHGTYTEVVPNKRLAQRWDFDIFLAPGEKSYPILISIDLEALPPEAGGGTKMTFTQGPMARPDFTEGSRQGVRNNFEKLAKALAT